MYTLDEILSFQGQAMKGIPFAHPVVYFQCRFCKSFSRRHEHFIEIRRTRDSTLISFVVKCDKCKKFIFKELKEIKHNNDKMSLLAENTTW